MTIKDELKEFYNNRSKMNEENIKSLAEWKNKLKDLKNAIIEILDIAKENGDSDIYCDEINNGQALKVWFGYRPGNFRGNRIGIAKGAQLIFYLISSGKVRIYRVPFLLEGIFYLGDDDSGYVGYVIDEIEQGKIDTIYVQKIVSEFIKWSYKEGQP